MVSGWQPPALGAAINRSKEPSQLEQPHAGAGAVVGRGRGLSRDPGSVQGHSGWRARLRVGRSDPRGCSRGRGEPAAALPPTPAFCRGGDGARDGARRGAMWGARAAPGPWPPVPGELSSAPGKPCGPAGRICSSSKASGSAGRVRTVLPRDRGAGGAAALTPPAPGGGVRGRDSDRSPGAQRRGGRCCGPGSALGAAGPGRAKGREGARRGRRCAAQTWVPAAPLRRPGCRGLALGRASTGQSRRPGCLRAGLLPAAGQPRRPWAPAKLPPLIPPPPWEGRTPLFLTCPASSCACHRAAGSDPGRTPGWPQPAGPAARAVLGAAAEASGSSALPAPPFHRRPPPPSGTAALPRPGAAEAAGPPGASPPVGRAGAEAGAGRGGSGG